MAVTADWLIDCTVEGRMLEPAAYHPPEATEQLLDLYPFLRAQVGTACPSISAFLSSFRELPHSPRPCLSPDLVSLATRCCCLCINEVQAGQGDVRVPGADGASQVIGTMPTALLRPAARGGTAVNVPCCGVIPEEDAEGHEHQGGDKADELPSGRRGTNDAQQQQRDGAPDDVHLSRQQRATGQPSLPAEARDATLPPTAAGDGAGAASAVQRRTALQCSDPVGVDAAPGMGRREGLPPGRSLLDRLLTGRSTTTPVQRRTAGPVDGRPAGPTDDPGARSASAPGPRAADGAGRSGDAVETAAASLGPRGRSAPAVPAQGGCGRTADPPISDACRAAVADDPADGGEAAIVSGEAGGGDGDEGRDTDLASVLERALARAVGAGSVGAAGQELQARITRGEGSHDPTDLQCVDQRACQLHALSAHVGCRQPQHRRPCVWTLSGPCAALQVKHLLMLVMLREEATCYCIVVRMSCAAGRAASTAPAHGASETQLLEPIEPPPTRGRLRSQCAISLLAL